MLAETASTTPFLLNEENQGYRLKRRTFGRIFWRQKSVVASQVRALKGGWSHI
jgi:hypothetical protein